MGMSIKPQLHFVHGNGFPAGTYTAFLNELKSDYQIDALPMHGHHPAYPVTNGWANLTQELIVELSQRYSEPVILLGHSFGGLLSLLVADQRPDLVRCVVMVDSPLVTGWRSLVLKSMRRLGLDKKYSPSRFAVKRRQHWPSYQDAFEHFAMKEKFAIWPEPVLHDYLKYGLRETEQGMELVFDRIVESEIYDTMPADFSRILKRGLLRPIGFVGGDDSHESRLAGLAGVQKLVGEHFSLLSGTHLLPMESPVATAHAVHIMIQRLLSVEYSKSNNNI
jgi:pimeloyl-ACP methyl ester carboxylesterase